MPNSKCKKCGKDFYVKPYFIKIGFGKYCSRECHFSDKNGKLVSCDICGKKTYRMLSKIKRSKSGKFFCDKSCQTKWRNVEFSGQKHTSWKGGDHTYRRILEKNSTLIRCRLCGEKDKRVLVVHHIDKNRKNNKVANLVWLCFNCHSLVHYDRLEERKLLEMMVTIV
ncbi:MAG: HNH endonuclease signature motif containing protein [Candidatus Paceibacterota bacterium]